MMDSIPANPTYAQVLYMIGGSVLATLAGQWFFHWRRSQEQPVIEIEALRTEVGGLRETLTGVRGQVKYIEGRMNGTHWRGD